MEISQKTSTYDRVLGEIRSELAKIYEEASIYKFVVDNLSQLPFFSWIGVYFFNPVTEEFYLGYYTGELPKTTVIKLKQLKSNKYEMINDFNAEQTPSVGPEVNSECKLLLEKDHTKLSLIVIGSENSYIFDEIDQKYLLEIAETIVDRVYYR